MAWNTPIICSHSRAHGIDHERGQRELLGLTNISLITVSRKPRAKDCITLTSVRYTDALCFFASSRISFTRKSNWEFLGLSLRASNNCQEGKSAFDFRFNVPCELKEVAAA